MPRITQVLLTLLVLSATQFCLAQNKNSIQGPNDLLVGLWEPADKDKRVLVQVFEDGRGRIAGKILGKYDEDGTYREAPPTQIPLLVEGFSYSEDGIWRDGQITDPDDGKNYSGRIKMLKKDLLEVRAYLGIFWKDMEWVKADSPHPSLYSLK